ncbi:MAG: sugar-binding protein [Bacteroidota bacterium]|nr:sugar-binding protein [Bacteroidota bacterium]
MFQKSATAFTPVQKAIIAPKVDGKAHDPAWQSLEWKQMDHIWSGTASANSTIQYKLAWTPDALYVLLRLENIEIQSTFGNPMEHFNSEDHLSIYVDEDNSAGSYDSSYNAFTYQIFPSNTSVFLGQNKKLRTANHAVYSALKNYGIISYWELRVTNFDSTFTPNAPHEAVSLKSGKLLGFALAFEHVDAKATNTILGSVAIPEDYEGRIDLDAGLFETLKLIQ